MLAVYQLVVLLVFALPKNILANDKSLPEDVIPGSAIVDKTLNGTANVPKTSNQNITDSGVWARKINANLLTLKPEMFQTFYVFLGISFLLIFFILFRMHKMRSHRAERRYGVQGDKSAQELTHLPTAMEEDESELEDDETLFDINKTRVYVA